jgi:predicted nucleic acid-binding protein
VIARSAEENKLYLDANAIIYALEDGNPWTEALRRLLRRVVLGEILAVTSALTLAEVLAKPYAVGDGKLIEQYEALLATSSPIQVAPIDALILRRAARVRGTLRLKLADAIHVATAMETGCTRLLSNDHRVLNALVAPLTAYGMDRVDTL